MDKFNMCIETNMYTDSVKHKWGQMMVEREDGTVRVYKDAVIWQDGSRNWNWGVTGTRHTPGVQIGDLKPLMRTCDIIILTRGVDGMLRVPARTVEYLSINGKEVHILKTPAAVRLFNKLLREDQRVGGLFHSTC